MRRYGVRWGVAPLILAMFLVTGGATARADACSDCGPPTLEDLQGVEGFELEVRGLGARDSVHLHAGECQIKMVGAPRIEKKLSWLVLRAAGAVWNCPSSTGSDTMIAMVAQSDSRDWSFSVSSSASASVLGVGLSAEVVATVSEASTVQQVTTISKVMSAAFCRVIAWGGYFEVADYEADVTFTVERRFGWWTKNVFTGNKVHRAGEIWLSCGTHEATLDMRAPIAGYFRLHQSPCPDPECKAIPTKELGWFPNLPNGLKPPSTEGEEEDDEEQEPEEDAPEEEAPEEEAPEEEGDGSEPAPSPPSDEEGIPSSDELGEAPTGPLPSPPGFEPAAGAEPAP